MRLWNTPERIPNGLNAGAMKRPESLPAPQITVIWYVFAFATINRAQCGALRPVVTNPGKPQPGIIRKTFCGMKENPYICTETRRKPRFSCRFVTNLLPNQNGGGFS